MDFKIFVNEDADTRLLRRIKRDMIQRGRTLNSVLYQWHKTVKPSYDEYVHQTLKNADIIVNGNANNWRAINFIVSNLKTILKNYIQARDENGDVKELDQGADNIKGENAEESKDTEQTAE